MKKEDYSMVEKEKITGNCLDNLLNKTKKKMDEAIKELSICRKQLHYLNRIDEFLEFFLHEDAAKIDAGREEISYYLTKIQSMRRSVVQEHIDILGEKNVADLIEFLCVFTSLANSFVQRYQEKLHNYRPETKKILFHPYSAFFSFFIERYFHMVILKKIRKEAKVI